MGTHSKINPDSIVEELTSALNKSADFKDTDLPIDKLEEVGKNLADLFSQSVEKAGLKLDRSQLILITGIVSVLAFSLMQSSVTHTEKLNTLKEEMKRGVEVDVAQAMYILGATTSSSTITAILVSFLESINGNNTDAERLRDMLNEMGIKFSEN